MSMSESAAPAPEFSERLWPAPSLYLALLLILPAVALVMTPLNAALAIPVAIGVFAAITGSLVLASPKVSVVGGELIAGPARIPVRYLGETRELDAHTLRAAIGPRLDARAHLMVRGYIHSGVLVEVTDENDPAPYWVITVRKPKSLITAIDAARARA